MDTTEDDLIASLGRSLLQDLLADDSYNVDTLASLEAELDAKLATSSLFSTAPSVSAGGNSAANVVISHFNQRSVEEGNENGCGAADAWSQTLANSNANAVEDFLKADQHRKQQKQQGTKHEKKQSSNKSNILFEEYNLEDVPDIPHTMNIGGKTPPPPPGIHSLLPPNAPPPGMQALLPPIAKMGGPNMGGQKMGGPNMGGPNIGSNTGLSLPPPGMHPPPPGMILPPMGPSQHQHQQPQPQPQASAATPPGFGRYGHAMGHPPPLPAAVVYPSHGVSPPHCVPPLYNNPHPRAPPVSIRATSLMPARDISYIVSSIMRSLSSGSDFYFTHYTHSSNSPNSNSQSKEASNSKFKAIIAQKSKEWKVEKKVLGQVLKSDVQRPRALLDIKLVKTEPIPKDNEREALWRSRIAIEKLHTQMLNHSNNNNNPIPPPPSHCMQAYWYMAKGRILLARCLQLNLFTPNIIKHLVPFLNKNMGNPLEGEERVWRAAITHTVWKMNQQDVLQSMHVVISQIGTDFKKHVLNNTDRVQFMYAILARGTDVCDAQTWDNVQTQFQNLLK